MRRVIFALLYDRGQFMLSRNFRLQAVGSIDWLFDNYDFATVSRGLDELMVLDVSRGTRDAEAFATSAGHIAGRCFIPLTVGGGITSFSQAQVYMRAGADKLLLNTAFATDRALCRSLADHFGRQCIVAGVDYRKTDDGGRSVLTHAGAREAGASVSEWSTVLQEHGAGEILLQSIDKDGTGMGLDLGVFNELPRLEVPCIIMGGVGKPDHILEGLRHPAVDAVATANLFNFIGTAFLRVRRSIADAGIDVPDWDSTDYGGLRDRFAGAR